MPTKKTTKEFIEDAEKLNGKGKYDYSKVDYVNNKTKIIIICLIHGEFLQKPNYHLGGSGCPKCAGNIKYSTKEWIEKARSLTGDKYNYSKVDYKGTHEKVIIICKIHGEFSQTAKSHLFGHGCPKCANIICANINKPLSAKEWIEKAKEIRGDEYLYSKANYINSSTKIIIICKIHGDFLQNPYHHLSGSGCPKCKNKTEGILSNFLFKNYEILHQYKPSWCINLETNNSLPFDFLLDFFRVIIELDGRQHFVKVSNWEDPEKTHERDLYKMKKANENGFSVIRILQKDVFNNKFDWKTELLDKISYLIENPKVENVFICKNGEYDNFMDN